MEVIEGVKQALGLGLEPRHLDFLQVSLRALIVFVATLVMVRLGNKRFLARLSAFDAIVTFILASMMARAVNGSSSFFPTIGAGFVIVLFHRLLGFIALHSHFFSQLIKGSKDIVIEQGQVSQQAMRRQHLTQEDLLEELRSHGKVTDPSQVKLATVERSGTISVIK